MRRWSRWRRRVVLAVGVALALFVAFEVGVRLVTPDAVQYEKESSINGGPVTVATGVVTDPMTIATWRAAVVAQPTDRSLPTAYIHAWLKLDTCAPLGYYAATYRFTWHGLPVEVVSPAPTCGYGLYEVSRGGLPDWQTYAIDFDTLPGL